MRALKVIDADISLARAFLRDRQKPENYKWLELRLANLLQEREIASAHGATNGEK